MQPRSITSPRFARSTVSRRGKPITKGTSRGGPPLGRTSISEKGRASQNAHVAKDGRMSLSSTKRTQLAIKKGKLRNLSASSQKKNEDSNPLFSTSAAVAVSNLLGGALTTRKTGTDHRDILSQQYRCGAQCGRGECDSAVLSAGRVELLKQSAFHSVPPDPFPPRDYRGCRSRHPLKSPGKSCSLWRVLLRIDPAFRFEFDRSSGLDSGKQHDKHDRNR